jgi:Putative beta-barrel porin-2, OmpL-like. bbp2
MQFSKLFAALCGAMFCFTQTAWTQTKVADSTKITFSGYAELYYGYDGYSPQGKERPSFIYNHRRHGETNLNLALAKVNYTTDAVRGNLALMTGNYAQYNMAGEPVLLRIVNEANIGVRLSQKHDVWLDAGVMPSHIGAETAIGADNWTASRSLVAESSPYFETGVKVTKTNKAENLTLAVLFLNGWQRIQKPDAMQIPSFGGQVVYKPLPNLTLNYSNFIGTDKPDSLQATRTYHNIYGVWEADSTWSVLAGVDIGRDKDGAGDYGMWYAPLVVVRARLAGKSCMAWRGEYFYDKKQVYQTTGTENGFQVFGTSLNYDYAIAQSTLFRVEAKAYFSKDAIFEYKNTAMRNNYALLLTLSQKL